MAPIVHGLEAEFKDRIIFSYLDIDDPATKPLKESLKYKVQPHFFLLDGNGIVLNQWLGFVPEEELRAAMNAATQ